MLTLFAVLSAACPGESVAGAHWTLTASESKTPDGFGYSVALHADTLAVGVVGDDEAGPDAGAVFVYRRTGESWEPAGKLLSRSARAGDAFGCSLAVRGDRIVVGARRDDGRGGNAGAVFVFERSGDGYEEVQELHASDATPGALFGHDLALDGDRLVVGAWGDAESGAAYVFGRRDGVWLEEGKLVSASGSRHSEFGRCVDLEGDRVVVGAPQDDSRGPRSGAAFVFDRVGAHWVERGVLLPEGGRDADHFGASVTIESGRIAIGAPGDDQAGTSSGAVWVFEGPGTARSARRKLVADDGRPGAQFGTSVHLLADRLVVGASNDSATVLGGGAAYVFARRGADWIEQRRFTADAATPRAALGWDVALDGRYLVAGSLGEERGAAYLFTL